ncbi:hypothetical protein MJO28_011380 [Puccinia striiformis f. sp. tritici]|uniref:Uncharacterized protein n=1 Tax=Puccinia striiformis f. sp. tritici TaxID=168172 RepID=A0ACC0E2D0_9BASI|nr:hypothetical protein MJO28_011380 [Puccinia striiformis f. sp. tritici]
MKLNDHQAIGAFINKITAPEDGERGQGKKKNPTEPHDGRMHSDTYNKSNYNNTIELEHYTVRYKSNESIQF